ncbi:MAG: DUF4838 domain-containing protein [Armatimonadetes bacterium]|nr:DUF4838 domain-containing protein [Armatimonadota bacterium]
MPPLLDYARNHPEVDALHFWLSDAPNNHCECELCRDYGPWDWYATLINELSGPLKEVAPDMKLVIIAYHDLLWPPEKVELDTSHNNLIVMFAPISRCYGHSLADPGCGEEPSLQRPARNEMDTPRENRSLVWLWQQWDWTDRANCFVFDYHFYRCPWMGDGLSVDLPAVISQDIADYAELGLGGLINCQVQRVFYPTGWPLFMTARLLAGETLSADERFRYFSYAYGANALTALDFLEGVRQVSDCPFGGAEWCHQVKPERLQQMREFLRAQEPRLVGAAEDAESPTQHRSWQLLLHYYELLSRFITAQEFREIGDLDAAVAQIEDIEEFVRRTEPETARALDSYLLLVNLSNLRKQWSE